MSSIIFYVIASLMILSSSCVVLSRNPVYSVLFLIFTFFNGAALLVVLNAEFLAMVLIIVYVGAVAVLFLFVVMLINVQAPPQKKNMLRYTLSSLCLIVLLGLELFIFFKKGFVNFKPVSNIANNNQDLSSVVALGAIIFNDYNYVFIVSGLILTVAMIGAVIISEKDGIEMNKRQNITSQNKRSKERTVNTMKVDIEEGIK